MRTLWRLAVAVAGTALIAIATFNSSVKIAEKVNEALEKNEHPDDEESPSQEQD
ncbi:MAG: hypothetical protein K6G61_10375 [Solobacterium sp.]|nr:hypothetical protein [Solobacterium sp.]